MQTKNITTSFIFSLFVLFMAHSVLAKAVSANSAESLFELGYAAELGKGTEPDYGKAIEYYQQAVELDHSQAIHNLGSLYNSGLGVQRNREKALSLWRRSSSLGNQFSTFNLGGGAYLRGDGYNRDLSKALEYFLLSHSQGYKPAACTYARVNSDGNSSHDLSFIKENIPYLSQHSDVKCRFALVGILFDHVEYFQQTELLFRLASELASEDYADAIFVLGLMHVSNRHGQEKDLRKAAAYYLKAAELGHGDAFANLGYLHESGELGRPDLETARQYYEKAVESGSVIGMNNLAIFHRAGLGGVVDLDLAYRLYTKAAELGNVMALINLGHLNKDFDGLQIDHYNAQMFYEEAYEKGGYASLLYLSELYSDESSPLFDLYAAKQSLEEALERQVVGSEVALSKLLSGSNLEFFASDSDSPEAAYTLAMKLKEKGDNEAACKWYKVAFDKHHETAFENVMRCITDNHISLNLTAEQVARTWAVRNEWDVNSYIGELYFYGIEVPQDYNKARVFFERSVVEVSDSIAANNLGKIYRDGLAITSDINKAMTYFEIAAQQGLSLGYYNMAKEYRSGERVAINPTLAFEYMQKAAAFKDSPEVMFEYAKMLNTGYAGQLDISASHEWMERARVENHKEVRMLVINKDISCALSISLRKHGETTQELERREQLKKHCDLELSTSWHLQ